MYVRCMRDRQSGHSGALVIAISFSRIATYIHICCPGFVLGKNQLQTYSNSVKLQGGFTEQL